MMVPYIPTFLMQSVEEARRDSIEVFVDFIHNKYGELPDLDITTLVVPFTCGKHWSVYVLGEFGYFHFDSMVTIGLHADSKRCVILAKMWYARKWYDNDYDIWAEAQSPHSWIEAQVTQQNSGWTCGFYMLKNIMEFIRALRYRPHTLREVIKT